MSKSNTLFQVFIMAHMYSLISGHETQSIVAGNYKMNNSSTYYVWYSDTINTQGMVLRDHVQLVYTSADNETYIHM